MDIQQTAEELAKEIPLNDIHNVAAEFIERLYQIKGLEKRHSDKIVTVIMDGAEVLCK